jgi:hypothetical protein
MRSFHNSSFDPQTLVLIETAFDEAWLTLKSVGNRTVKPDELARCVCCAWRWKASAIPFDRTTELWSDCYPRQPGARRADRGAVPSKAIVGLSRLRKTARISIKINIQPKSPRAADNEFHGNYNSRNSLNCGPESGNNL